jgi:signal transduction histidine kinase
MIGIREDEGYLLEELKQLFIGKKDAFADYFYDFFHDIADTRRFLDEEKKPGHMKRVWAGWFAAFFQSRPDDEFLAYLWGVGVRHVEVSLDQRFSNLGFAMIRQFCHKIVVTEVPPEQRSLALYAINKKLDLCLLAETSAYIENTISCDIEVMREVADRVRNPAMVIGWNIRRLQGRAEKGTKEYDVYQMLMGENQRLENMVKDIKVYMDIFQGEPDFYAVDIKGVIASILEKVKVKGMYSHVNVSVEVQEQARRVKGDQEWMGHLFYYLIENSMEAAGKERAFVKISSQLEVTQPFNIRIELFNSGEPPTDESERLFTPFFSTKAEGTGFGLPIARLVARKHHGTLAIHGEKGEGTRVIISLPPAG